MSQKSPASPQSLPPLVQALGQSDSIKEIVKQSADELLVINAVLKQEIPGDSQTGDVAQALQKTDQLEVRIQESAEDLAQVNELLQQEITEREQLELELAATQAALAKAEREKK